jgi:hypothetical protein
MHAVAGRQAQWWWRVEADWAGGRCKKIVGDRHGDGTDNAELRQRTGPGRGGGGDCSPDRTARENDSGEGRGAVRGLFDPPELKGGGRSITPLRPCLMPPSLGSSAETRCWR